MRNGRPFAKHLGSEYEEEQSGEEIGITLRYQCWYSMAENSGEDSHDDQGAESRREHDHPRVFHCHQRSDEECFVADLGKDDHGEG